MHPDFRRTAKSLNLRHEALSYGKHRDQVVDILALPDAVRRPLVVVIHGGFWREQYDRGHTAPQCASLATEGYVVAAIEYRRVGGGGGWLTTFTDLAGCLDNLPKLIGEIDPELIDPERVVLMGHSAGGHLALWAASRHNLPKGMPARRSTPPPIRGVISLAGVASLEWAVAAGLGSGAVEDLVGAPPENDPENRYAYADPMQLLPIGLPAICIHGGLDEDVPPDCAAVYVASAMEAGDPADFRVLPWEDHFAVISPGSQAWPHVIRATADLLG